VAGGELVDAANATFEEKRAVYQEFVRQAALKGFKPGWAAYRYKDAFGCWPKGFVEDVRREAMRERVMEATSA
jgi:NAD(P)H-flavin reductase